MEENKISPLISIHYEYIKQRKREEEKRSAARRGALTVVVFVFEETARENRERTEREERERDFVRLEPQRIKQERIARVQSVTKRTHAH